MSFPQFKSLVKEVASTAFPDFQEPIRQLFLTIRQDFKANYRGSLVLDRRSLRGGDGSPPPTAGLFNLEERAHFEALLEQGRSDSITRQFLTPESEELKQEENKLTPAPASPPQPSVSTAVSTLRGSPILIKHELPPALTPASQQIHEAVGDDEELLEFVRLEESATRAVPNRQSPPPSELGDIVSQALTTLKRQQASLTVYHSRGQLPRHTPQQSLIKQSRSFSPDRAMTSLGVYPSPFKMLGGGTASNTPRHSDERAKDMPLIPKDRSRAKPVGPQGDWLLEMKAKAQQQQSVFDIAQLTEDMRRKFAVGSSMASAEQTMDAAGAPHSPTDTDERIPTLSSIQNNASLNVSAVKVSRIDLTFSDHKEPSLRKKRETSVSAHKPAGAGGLSSGRFGPVLKRKEVELTRGAPASKKPLSPRQKSESVRNQQHPHHQQHLDKQQQQSQLGKGLRAAKQLHMPKIETSPRVTQKLTRVQSKPQPKVAVAFQLIARARVLYRLKRRLNQKCARTVMARWRGPKALHLAMRATAKLLRQQMRRALQKWRERAWMKERQEMGKKCESLRRVGVGAQRMEALLVRKRLLEECLGQWRREAWMTRSNSCLSKRLEQMLKLSADFETTLGED